MSPPPQPTRVSLWNLANLLTMSRMVLVPVFVLALFTRGGSDPAWRVTAALIFGVASLTDRLDGLTFSMQFRGTSMRISISGDELTVHTLTEGFSRPVRIAIGGAIRELAAGEEWVAPLHRRPTVTENSDRSGGRSDHADTQL